MALGTPYDIGSATTASSGVSTVAVGTATTAGDAIFVCTADGGLTNHVNTITDTQGNVYALASRYNAAGVFVDDIWAAVHGSGGPGTNTAALSLTDSLTITWSATPSAPRVDVIGCSGVDNTSTADQVAANNGSSSSPSSGTTATLAQASELAIGNISDGHAGGALTWTGGWTGISSVTQGSGAFMATGYLITSSTAGVAATGTVTSVNWTANVATFKAATASGTTVNLTTAQENVAALAPALQEQLSLAAAGVNLAAPAPSLREQISLAAAGVNISAPAPSLREQISLTAARVNINAPAPSQRLQLALPVAQVAINALAPTVSVGGGGSTVSLTKAAVSVGALAPSPRLSLSLPVAHASVAAPAPSSKLSLALSAARVSVAAFPVAITAGNAPPLGPDTGGTVTGPYPGGTASEGIAGGSVTQALPGGSVTSPVVGGTIR